MTVSSSARLVGVGRETIDDVWNDVAPMIADVARRGGNCWTVDSIRERLIAGTMQLWVATVGERFGGIVVTDVHPSSAGKTCSMPIIWGDALHEWIDRLDAIEAWARDAGCVRLEGIGRDGWQKPLAPYGWRKTGIVIEKRL